MLGIIAVFVLLAVLVIVTRWYLYGPDLSRYDSPPGAAPATIEVVAGMYGQH